MPENPYQTPDSSLLEFAQTASLSVAELHRLRRIAESQRRLWLCVLGQLVLYLASPMVPWASVEFIWVALLILSLCCVVQLVSRLQGWLAALAVGILSMVPMVGVAVLFSVVASAAWILRRAGFKIGWLGVSPRQIKDAIDAQMNAPFSAPIVPEP